MLAKKHKLTGTKDFERVKKDGKVSQFTDFGVAIVSREDTNLSRFAFIISTKIAKEAVDRNRIKRALSEAVRIRSIDLAPGFDVVFLAKTSIARVSTSEIMKEVYVALKETNLLK